MDLQPFFNTDRTKRLDSLSPERRKAIEDEAQASGQGDAHTDRVLVGMWLSERTGLERTHLYRKLKQLGIESRKRSS